MPLIIAATDFSLISENAANYACQLALAQNARLTIIHSFVFPVMFSDIPLPAALINETVDDLDTEMKKVVDRFKMSYAGLDIQGIVVDGDLVGALEEYTKKNEAPWLVVLGNSNTGEHTIWESNMLAAFKSLEFPVLAIPPETAYKPVKKICLAFDNKHKGNDLAFTQLRDLSVQLNAGLEVLNAQVDVLNRDNLPPTDEQAQTILAPANPHFHVVYDTNIDTAIESFTNSNNIDWLALIPRKHSFFEGLFHKSQSKVITHHAHIPVLALHETHTP